MNRYWFDTNNGSRFSMSRIHMYPRFGISWWLVHFLYIRCRIWIESRNDLVESS